MVDIAEWLSPVEAGRRLRLTSQRILQLTGNGTLRYVWTANGRLIDPKSVEEEIARREASASEKNADG